MATATASCDCPVCGAHVDLSASNVELGQVVTLTGGCTSCGNTVYIHQQL